MNDLIKINRANDGEATVSGRELHQALEIKTAYKDWFPRMVEYGFVEGEDFCSFLSESTGGRPSTDHAITLDMAKEICMIQRTPQGRACRQYFIQAEKEYRNNCFNYQQLAERVERLEKMITQPLPQTKEPQRITLCTETNLKGGKLMIYSIIANDENAYNYTLRDFSNLTNLTQKNILRVLKNLVQEEYITKEVEYINKVKYCHYSIKKD